MNDLLDTALSYLAQGWSVIPITPGQKAPPLVKWEDYEKRRPTVEEVEQWFTTWQDANVAIVTGAISGITVVDIDGPNGIQTARERLFEGKVTTRKHRTPKGFHVFFQYTSQFHTGAGFLDGIDIRNDGGYIIAPPSQVDGKRYSVVEDSPLMVLPFGLDAFNAPVVVPFRPREASQGQKEEQPTWVSEALNGVPEDYRNDTATRLIGYFHSLGMPKDIIFEVLTPFAEKCRPPMDLRELERSIESVTRYQSQAGHLGVIDPPALERKGGMYIYHWPALGTKFTFDEVAITKDGKHAELTIHAEQPGVSTLHYGPVHLNLASTQAHNSLARYLTGRLALENWPVLIEQACNLTILAEKQGEPLVDLRERPLVKLEKYLLYPLILDNLPVILFGDGGTGKALAIDTPLPTPTGWSTMRDIEPGDYVLDDKGCPVRVVAVSPVMYDRPCYRIKFSDASELVADAQHEWVVEPALNRARVQGRPRNQRYRDSLSANTNRQRYSPRLRQPMQCLPRYGQTAIVTTEEMASNLFWREEHNFAIAVAAPILGHECSLPIEPYTLGAWLGDGTSNAAEITSKDEEVLQHIQQEGYPITVRRNILRYGISSGKKGGSFETKAGTFQGHLRLANLLSNKHIPSIYLRASFTQRLALLQGLMDTDGSMSRSSAEFTTTSVALADGIYELVVSLGMKATKHEGRSMLYGRDCGPKWRIAFRPMLPIFRLPRKAKKVLPLGRQAGRARRRYVVGVEPIPSVPTRCIQVESTEGVFLVGKSFIPTHNSLLALALQLTLETGAKSILDITPNRRVKGLFLDWEFDQRFHQERYEAMRNGAFLTESMENIIGYRRCYLPLEQELSAIHKMVDEEGFGFLTIDSAAAACGGEPEKTGPAMSFFNALRKLNVASLIVAHQTKDTERTDKPFGSSFWWNMARMVWKAEKVQDANDSMLAIGLYNKKNNVDKLHAPLSYYVNFSEGSVSFHQEDIFATHELAEKLPVWERIRAELKHKPMTTKALLEALGIAQKDRSKVDTALTRGRQTNMWAQNEEEMWELL